MKAKRSFRRTDREVRLSRDLRKNTVTVLVPVVDSNLTEWSQTSGRIRETVVILPTLGQRQVGYECGRRENGPTENDQDLKRTDEGASVRDGPPVLLHHSGD